MTASERIPAAGILLAESRPGLEQRAVALDGAEIRFAQDGDGEEGGESAPKRGAGARESAESRFAKDVDGEERRKIALKRRAQFNRDSRIGWGRHDNGP